MDIEELISVIEDRLSRLTPEAARKLASELKEMRSVFPFNDFEIRLVFLAHYGAITLDEYLAIRKEYIRANGNLHLFELAPRTFGQTWGEQHLCELDDRFKKASKALDSDFDGEYDLMVDKIKVEVKACRAIDTKKKAGIVSKALRSDSKNLFWMNYQQIKFDICDVFVFIGVWIDEIKYWVLSHDEVRNNRHLSTQHRGGIEYQIGIKNSNISEFDIYLAEADELVDKVVEKGP